jgi:diguanylate cyclase (GGDEF)-like protein/PAS domain S-box-containing protein
MAGAASCALALASAFAPWHAKAGERAYFFQRVNAAEDLSQNTVHAMLQDRTGFLWIATEGGLHRFDGYAFLSFEHSPEDPGSLPDSLTTALAEDGGGRLWVGSNGGSVAWFDAAAGRFVALPAPAGPRGPVGALLGAPDGGVWIASSRGIERVAADGTHADVLLYPRDNGPAAETSGIARDAEGRIWVSGSRGVFRIDAAGRRADRIAAAQLAAAQSVQVDASGRVWVGNADGLWRIGADDSANRAWAAPDAGHPVRAIAQAPDGRLWLATYGRGLVAFDPTTGASEILRRDAALAGGLPEDWLRSLLVDRSGLLWVGGDVFGVARFDPTGAKFRFLYDDAPGRPAFETNKIRSLLQDPDGSLWIGTEGDGLKRYDFAARRFQSHADALRAALPDLPPGADLRVFALAPDGAGGLWVGTNHGLLRHAPATRRTERIAVDPGGARGPPGAIVRTLLRARDGSLWVGTMDSGLARLAPDGGAWTTWRSAPADAGTLWNNGVLVLHEDRGGRIWVGTLDGLNLVDPATGMVRRMPRAGAARDTPAGDLVRAIHESADGSLWFGSHNGLSRLEEVTAVGARFSRHLVSDGLPASTVYGILEDTRGDLWLSTNRGVVRFDRANGRFHAYSVEDGLQGLEFNGGVQAALADGRLAFGGPHGINLFYPERLVGSEFAPRVAFTAWQAGAQRLPVLAPERFASVALDHDQRIVAFSVAALDFASPARNRFEYRLEGFDDRWYALGASNTITFTNLDAGEYVLRVRGSNRDGVLSPEEARLQLSVQPAWWMSLPMQVLYGALALALVGLPVWAWRQRVARESRHAREVQEREERLRVAIWGSGDEFWDYDLRNNVMVRIGADHLLGFEAEHRISADDWRSKAVHPDDRARVERVLDEHVSGQRDSFESEHRVRAADGGYVWVRSRGRIVERDAQGRALRVAGTARDVTRTRLADRERRIAEQVIRSMAEAVTVTDLEFRFVSINAAFTRMTGYVEAEVVGQDSAMLNCEQHSEDFHHALRRAAAQSGRWSGELWQRRKDGEEFLCWLELSEVIDDAGQRTHWVGVLTDITDRKRAEQELRYLANYDTLTGLPNRTLLGERLAHAMIRARRHGSKVAVLFLDLDRFKHVNDSMGHAAGDRLLKAAAARIQATVRDSDTVARLGGDEFTVVIEDLVDAAQAERVAGKLLEAFVAPLDIDGRTEVVISPSIGISIYPDHGQVPTDLLKYADTAMYQAKEKGRNTWQTYTEAMDAQARMRASMIAHLHKAIERGELSLVYQPKMSLVDGRITGVEALLRWRNPELGQVSPATFIPIAEETGLIVPIGEWVIREACVQVQRWMKAGLNATTIAVNVSMLQLLRGELYTKLRQLLEDFRVPAHRLELELTESMVMANAEQSISTLTQIKSLGVNLAIDDFGTGYSSLAYLKRLPIDTLKIDKEFVGDITTDPDDEAITATIITMAHSLGLDVVAEGVETQEQLDYLREQRCDEVQGHFVSPPIDGDRLFKFMLDRKAAAENKGEVREFPLRRG